jgi:hypothetical protein
MHHVFGIMQVAPQSLATTMPVAFMLDGERHRIKTCRALLAPPAAPSCGAWTELGQ